MQKEKELQESVITIEMSTKTSTSLFATGVYIRRVESVLLSR